MSIELSTLLESNDSEDLRNLLQPGRFIRYRNGICYVLLMKMQEPVQYTGLSNMAWPSGLYAVNDNGFMPLNSIYLSKDLRSVGNDLNPADRGFDIVEIYANVGMGQGLKYILENLPRDFGEYLIWRRPGVRL